MDPPPKGRSLTVPILTSLPTSDRHGFLAGRRSDQAASSVWTGDHSALKDLLCRGVCYFVLGGRVFFCPSSSAPAFPGVPSCSFEASVAIAGKWKTARRVRHSRRLATCGNGRGDRI
jgi:hypothetical protein